MHHRLAVSAVICGLLLVGCTAPAPESADVASEGDTDARMPLLGTATRDDVIESAENMDASQDQLLPIEGSCDLSSGEPCLPSCESAVTFAAHGTTPASSDMLAWSAAYLRITLPDGTEPEVTTELHEGNIIVESLASYDSQDAQGFRHRSYYYTSWGQQPDGPFTFGNTTEIDPSPSDLATPITHALRDTAQFLDTPMGCIHNPHRANDAATAPGPGAPTPTASPTEPVTSQDGSDEGALPLFVELARAACDLAGIPDPTMSTTVGGHGAEILIETSDGVRLIVNFGNETVYSPDGPDAVMPRPYSFACDPTVFVGTMDH